MIKLFLHEISELWTDEGAARIAGVHVQPGARLLGNTVGRYLIANNVSLSSQPPAKKTNTVHILITFSIVFTHKNRGGGHFETYPQLPS